MLHDRAVLVNGLSFVYRMIVASAPLLEFAIPRAAGGLRKYYEQHLEEERGHDEMLRSDLERLGVEEIPRWHAAAQIAGAQYYLIAHDHPALLLGYMHALERNTMRVEAVDELSAFHGVTLTALRHHAEHDPGHKRDLERMILQCDEELQKRIQWNEENTLVRLAAVRT
jgi:hypothetical protein